MQAIEEPVPTTDLASIKKYRLKHLLPREVWEIAYDPHSLVEWKEGYPANTWRGPGPFADFPRLPVTIGEIDFPQLIEDLSRELDECSSAGLPGLRAKEEQALQCVRLAQWLLEQGRL